MLIFEGDFVSWSIDSINKHIKPCKAEHLDRRGLLRILNSSPQEMKIFATIKGNDFTKCYYSEMSRMWPTHIAAEYNEDFYKNIAKTMLKNGIDIKDEHIESVKKSLMFYKLYFELQQANRNMNVLQHCFENGYPFPFDAQFMDF